jgi:antitoxin CptB
VRSPEAARAAPPIALSRRFRRAAKPCYLSAAPAAVPARRAVPIRGFMRAGAMTDELETRKKRLLFQSWHRGSRETDLVLGRFADRYLASMDKPMLDQFEQLLGEEDADIWNWITGRDPLPEDLDNGLTRMVLASAGVVTDQQG